MSETLSVLVIPVEGPLETHELGDDSLGKLQELVGGCIEAVPLPDFVNGADSATAYIHEEGKYEYPAPEGVNWRATDFMVPGVGLFMGDYIAGPFVLAGFNPEMRSTVLGRTALSPGLHCFATRLTGRGTTAGSVAAGLSTSPRSSNASRLSLRRRCTRTTPEKCGRGTRVRSARRSRRSRLRRSVNG